jgi:carbamoyltransferase
VDGRVVSASAEESFARVAGIGYARTGGFPSAAVEACLNSAGLEPEDIDQIVIVDDGVAKPPLTMNGAFRAVTVREIAPERADAIHASEDKAAGIIVVAGAHTAGISLFSRNGGGLGPRHDVQGADGLMRFARKLAALLGHHEHDAVSALDRLSVGADPAFQDDLRVALAWRGERGVHADDGAVTQIAARVAGGHAGQLGDRSSLNARVQDLRRSLAASFIGQTAEVIAGAAGFAAEHHGAETVAAGGSLFGHARLNTELVRLMPCRISVAAVPEALGRAIGAASSEAGATPSAGPGPAFSDEDIKRTLDNCRLDYVYEPDWPRLISRASRMLATGKVVAWFQGPMAFGPRPLGSRSVLSDPSNRYARQNVNEYLRHAPLDEPLPVALAPSARTTCGAVATVRHGVIDVPVPDTWRQKLSGAADWRNFFRTNDLWVKNHPFEALLEHHFSTTGTPGLIETGLANPGEPLACTPRDAIRTMFSSATDALVIGRFLLMKDYWLLRHQDQ